MPESTFFLDKIHVAVYTMSQSWHTVSKNIADVNVMTKCYEVSSGFVCMFVILAIKGLRIGLLCHVRLSLV